MIMAQMSTKFSEMEEQMRNEKEALQNQINELKAELNSKCSTENEVIFTAVKSDPAGNIVGVARVPEKKQSKIQKPIRTETEILR